MEIKNKLIFEIIKDDLPYRLELPGGCPLGDAYQCVGQFMDKIVELIKDHQEKRKKQEEENGKEDERREEKNTQGDA